MPFWNIITGSHAFDELLFTNTTGFFKGSHVIRNFYQQDVAQCLLGPSLHYLRLKIHPVDRARPKHTDLALSTVRDYVQLDADAMTRFKAQF